MKQITEYLNNKITNTKKSSLEIIDDETIRINLNDFVEWYCGGLDEKHIDSEGENGNGGWDYFPHLFFNNKNATVKDVIEYLNKNGHKKITAQYYDTKSYNGVHSQYIIKLSEMPHTSLNKYDVFNIDVKFNTGKEFIDSIEKFCNIV